jgi:hypothetical protein
MVFMDDHLKDLTIIILSRGREQNLSKSLNFWNSNGIRTVVIHNSEIGIEQKTEVEGSVYLRSNTSYAVRAGIAATHITTNFAIICNDDELYIPTTLNKMILKLNENIGLTSVGAQSIAVSKYGDMTTGTLCYTDMWQYENLYEAPIDRLMCHLALSKNHIGAMFRMLRVKTMIDLLSSFKLCDEISTPYIHESTSEILLTIYGKSAYINEIYWIRNWQEPEVQHKNWDRKLYFQTWWEGVEFTEQRAIWIKILIKFSSGLIELKDIGEILEKNYKLRKVKELHEQAKRKIGVNILSTKLKYRIKKFFLPTKLPLSLEIELARAKTLGIQLDEIEIHKIVKILI